MVFVVWEFIFFYRNEILIILEEILCNDIKEYILIIFI